MPPLFHDVVKASRVGIEASSMAISSAMHWVGDVWHLYERFANELKGRACSFGLDRKTCGRPEL